MAGKNTAVLGIYPSQTDLELALNSLKAAGFRNTDISVLVQENLGTKDFSHEKSTKAPEGAAAGAGTGAVIGGVLGWLGWHRITRHPRPGAVYRSRTHRGSAGWHGRSWRSGRYRRSVSRSGNAGI
jgi:hypothetical protein